MLDSGKVQLKNFIAAPLLLSVFLVSLLAVMLTLFHMAGEYIHQRYTVMDQLKFVHLTHQSSLEVVSLEADSERWQSILAEMLEHSIISGVKIEDLQGKEIAAVGSTVDWPLKQEAVFNIKNGMEWFVYQFPITSTPQPKGENKTFPLLGRGSIFSNSASIMRQIQVGYAVIMVTSLINALILLIVFSGLRRVFLSRSLAGLRRTVNNVALAHFGGSQAYIKPRGQNELFFLENAFRHMAEELILARTQGKELDTRLTQSRDCLQAEVDKRTAALKKISQEFEREVLQRQHIEAELQKHQMERKVLLSAIPDLVFRVSKEGTFLDHNANSERDLYIPADQILGNNINAIFASELAKQMLRWINDALNTQEMQIHEYQLLLSRGLRDYEARIVVSDANEVLCILRDITERKEAETQIRKLFHATEQSSLGIMISDTNHVIEYVNSRFVKMTSYTGSELVGHRASDYCEWLPKDPENLLRMLESGNAYKGEHSTEKKSEGVTWFAFSIEPVKESNGRLTHFVVFLEDITERKKTEERHQQLEIQLRQSHKMEALGTLAGGIAHEFNNILGAILGYSSVLLKLFPQESKEKKYAENIREASHRAADLIRQILTFSRKGEKRQSIQNIAPIIKEALKMIKITVSSHIEIIEHVKNDCGAIMADVTQIHQVLMNLCINAAQSIEGESGTIEISLKEVSHEHTQGLFLGAKDQEYLELMIKDTGKGMASHVKPHIFEPFFTTKEVGQGTGLGLSVVYGIVEQHRGKIAFTSQEGVGSAFFVYFPMVTQKPKPSPKTEIVHLSGSGHIMIVEDEHTLTNLHADYLRSLGYDVTVFNKSTQALEAFSSNPEQFDLIFSDIAMPEKSGRSLTQEILSIAPHLPIILTTGYSSIISETEALKMGVRKFMMKPVDLNVLSEVIADCLRKNR
ncbi:ATP-binding protein [Deltaproteobacteria bacterium TL4]